MNSFKFEKNPHEIGEIPELTDVGDFFLHTECSCAFQWSSQTVITLCAGVCIHQMSLALSRAELQPFTAAWCVLRGAETEKAKSVNFWGESHTFVALQNRY